MKLKLYSQIYIYIRTHAFINITYLAIMEGAKDRQRVLFSYSRVYLSTLENIMHLHATTYQAHVVIPCTIYNSHVPMLLNTPEINMVTSKISDRILSFSESSSDPKWAQLIKSKVACSTGIIIMSYEDFPMLYVFSFDYGVHYSFFLSKTENIRKVCLSQVGNIGARCVTCYTLTRRSL